MSLLDDEDILIADNNPILNEIAKNRTKYLSYGFGLYIFLGLIILCLLIFLLIYG